jgi:hypothetical protein
MKRLTVNTTFAALGFCALAFSTACKKEEAPTAKPLPPLPSEKPPATPAVKPAVKPSTAPALDGKRVESPTGIAFDVPQGWTRQTPQSTMRVAELMPPRAAGETLDGILVVSYFAGGAGTFDANVDRWASQVSDENGGAKSASDGQVREIALARGGKVKIFEIVGTHTETNMRTGESKRTPNARLVVATLDTDAGSYFFKLVAPVKTADAAMPAFESLVKSVELK